MKVQTINVQISKCPKQYESVRLGGEWTVDKGETAEEVMEKALDILNQFYADSLKPKAPKGAAADAVKTAATGADAGEPDANAKEPETTGNVAEDKSKKTPLRFNEDSKTLRAICKRIEAGVKLDKVLDFYEPDADAMRVLKAAAEFNKNQTADK